MWWRNASGLACGVVQVFCSKNQEASTWAQGLARILQVLATLRIVLWAWALVTGIGCALFVTDVAWGRGVGQAGASVWGRLLGCRWHAVAVGWSTGRGWAAAGMLAGLQAVVLLPGVRMQGAVAVEGAGRWQEITGFLWLPLPSLGGCRQLPPTQD